MGKEREERGSEGVGVEQERGGGIVCRTREREGGSGCRIREREGGREWGKKGGREAVREWV